MNETTIWWVVGGLIVLAAIAAFVFTVLMPRRESSRLRKEFGPEYEGTVNRTGDRSRAEEDLRQRRERVRSFDIRSLSEQDRTRYQETWRGVQARFVDDPGSAIREAEDLLGRVMRDRGYPVEDFDQQASDLSVHYPALVDNYRTAHGVYLENERGRATTEELRRALVSYRQLFSELLDDRRIREAA